MKHWLIALGIALAAFLGIAKIIGLWTIGTAIISK